MIYCHKKETSIAMEKIPVWFAKTFTLGDFFEKKVGTSGGRFCRKDRRALVKAKPVRLTVTCLESCGEVSYFYLTDGTMTYRMKIVEGRKYVFLMDFAEGSFNNWAVAYDW